MNSYLTTTLEIKALKGNKFEGYGSVFGNVDHGGDIVVKGAFERTLKEHEESGTLPLMFWAHQMDQVPGKWLKMAEDSHGLQVEGELANTTLGKDVKILLDMKAVRGLSIGYGTKEADYTDAGIRLLKDVDLHETSIVSLAMNPLAEISHMKSRLSEKGEYVPELAEFKRKCEHFFIDEGVSKNVSRMLVSNLFKTSTGAMPDDTGAKPEKSDETIGDLTGATPEEIELRTGLADFEEQTTVYEMQKILKQTFG